MFSFKSSLGGGCGGMGKFWDSFPELPMHYDEGDDVVCRDERTGREIRRAKKPTGPGGIRLEMFEAHPAITLVDIGDPRGQDDQSEYGYFFPKGTKVQMAMMPTGHFCFMNRNVILYQDMESKGKPELILGQTVDWM